jgi:hypothetical protein
LGASFRWHEGIRSLFRRVSTTWQGLEA